METPSTIVVNLSEDHAKYITRFIGKAWKTNLGRGIVNQIHNVFGINLPSALILRRRTPDELLRYTLSEIKKLDSNVNTEDENLRHKLLYQIGLKTSGFIHLSKSKSVELVLKW